MCHNNTKVLILIERKYLYRSISTRSNSIWKYIRGDVKFIRSDFDTKVVNRIFWVLGRLKLYDHASKQDMLLQDSATLNINTERI